SAPLTMSAKSISSPVRSLTRLLRTRSEVPRSNWWKWIVWSSVALNSPTGIDTSPKLIEPVQIARAIPGLPSVVAFREAYPVQGGTMPRSGPAQQLGEGLLEEGVADDDRLQRQTEHRGSALGGGAQP